MEKYYKTESANICYKVHQQQKKKAIVFIHGFGITKEMWDKQLDDLKAYKVITVDVPHHGKSTSQKPLNLIHVCKEIVGILDQEGIEKTVIAGLSMGNYIAQEFVRLYPERTQGIFLADGSPIYMRYSKWETLSLKRSQPLFKLYTWERLKKAMARQSSVVNEVQSELIKMFDTQTKDSFIRSWSAIANALHEEDVNIISPMCYVYGEQDRTGTIQLHVKDWQVCYPKCEVHMIPNAGHVSNMDNPKVFNQILVDFLQKIYV
ncbi:hydrolase [Vallitalea longa]|uniref:Hydrolase n=1 Tax=Vallitalea longa TaxID=2936439 RepID=A0A9W5YE44_9FIRM|nr:alpha/beta hydrolase [Vallitalea longa]GKX30971.1 hydrolase [Vallitalea longa]